MCVFLCTTQYSACVFVVANGVVWVVIHTHLLHFLILEYSSRIKNCSLLRKWIVTLNINQKFVLLILYSYFLTTFSVCWVVYHVYELWQHLELLSMISLISLYHFMYDTPLYRVRHVCHMICGIIMLVVMLLFPCWFLIHHTFLY